MRNVKLIIFAAGTALAASSALLAPAPAAQAAAARAAASGSPGSVTSANDCTPNVTIFEGRDSSGAYVILSVISDPCGWGLEAAIEGPDGTPSSFGGDVHQGGTESITGPIPVNSGNNHGYRYWQNSKWNYNWVD